MSSHAVSWRDPQWLSNPYVADDIFVEHNSFKWPLPLLSYLWSKGLVNTKYLDRPGVMSANILSPKRLKYQDAKQLSPSSPLVAAPYYLL